MRQARTHAKVNIEQGSRHAGAVSDGAAQPGAAWRSNMGVLAALDRAPFFNVPIQRKFTMSALFASGFLSKQANCRLSIMNSGKTWRRNTCLRR
jgi:hypothetical protein